MNRKFRIFFIFKGREHSVDTESQFYVKEGFWLDERLQWCTAAQSRFFIPSHQILYMELLEKES